MKDRPPPVTNSKEEQIVLSLSDLTDLFNAPRVDPVSPSSVAVLGVSGMDYLLNLLYMRRKAQHPRTLLLLLPSEKMPTDRTEDVTWALRRLGQARVDHLRLELRNNSRYGWRVAGVAMILLAICLAISSIFASELTEGMPPHLRKTLEYSFEIVGWVLLWHPIEALAFTPLPLRYRIRALQALMGMDVVVRPQEQLKPL
jgi:hypothetical protein